MLSELDHELEARGHKFVRYADDMVIFCKSKASAIQTLNHITPYIERKLFLKVNMEKTVVAYASKLRGLTNRRKIIELEEWKRKLRYAVVGWVNYYKLADMWKLLAKTDEWLRRRIRMIILKKWKRVRTKYKNLRQLGISHENALRQANSRKGLWCSAETPVIHQALNNERLERNGFTFLLPRYEAVSIS